MCGAKKLYKTKQLLVSSKIISFEASEILMASSDTSDISIPKKCVPLDSWTVQICLFCRLCSYGHGWSHEADGRCEGLPGYQCQTKLYWPPAESSGQGPQRNHSMLNFLTEF